MTGVQTCALPICYIIGQKAAKRAVAIALRNRWRRQQLEGEMREEILPKNILMIGPTGVGKTEISRRLAKLANAPFIKIEATKFTEVGYVGRDVEQIIRDLVETSIGLVREDKRAEVSAKAHLMAEDRVLDALVGESAQKGTRETFRKKLREGDLDDKEIEVQVADTGGGMPAFDIPGMPGSQVGMININDIMGKAFGQRTKTRKMPVRDSHHLPIAEEAGKLVDAEAITREAPEAGEQDRTGLRHETDQVCALSDSRLGPGTCDAAHLPALGSCAAHAAVGVENARPHRSAAGQNRLLQAARARAEHLAAKPLGSLRRTKQQTIRKTATGFPSRDGHGFSWRVPEGLRTLSMKRRSSGRATFVWSRRSIPE